MNAGAREKSRLIGRPRRVAGKLSAGVQKLGLAKGRDGLLYVPSSALEKDAAPLIVSLHGSGGVAEHGLRLFRDLADRAGAIVVAPESREATWDVILRDFGPDVRYIDRALE